MGIKPIMVFDGCRLPSKQEVEKTRREYVWLLNIKRSCNGTPSLSYRMSLALWVHSVTCQRTQVNTPRLNPSQTGRYSIYLPWRDGRLSWPTWLVTFQDGLPAHRQSPIQLLTRHCRESDSQSVDHWSHAITTIPPSHFLQRCFSTRVLRYVRVPLPQNLRVPPVESKGSSGPLLVAW